MIKKVPEMNIGDMSPRLAMFVIGLAGCVARSAAPPAGNPRQATRDVLPPPSIAAPAPTAVAEHPQAERDVSPPEKSDKPAAPGPLCTRVMESSRKRQDIAIANYGDWALKWLAEPRAEEELSFCEEDEQGAWSFGIVGVEPHARACNPDASSRCSTAALRALRGTIRYTTRSKEVIVCWDRSTDGPVSCSAHLAAYDLWIGRFGFWHGAFPEQPPRILDIDHDGRAELLFLYQDSNEIDPHSWYVIMRLNAAGRALEQHPDSVSPSIVGVADVDGDGAVDLITRASTRRCSDDVDANGESICDGQEAPLLCRLATAHGYGRPAPCPRRKDSPKGDPDFGWGPLATGR